MQSFVVVSQSEDNWLTLRVVLQCYATIRYADSDCGPQQYKH